MAITINQFIHECMYYENSNEYIDLMILDNEITLTEMNIKHLAQIVNDGPDVKFLSEYTNNHNSFAIRTDILPDVMLVEAMTDKDNKVVEFFRTLWERIKSILNIIKKWCVKTFTKMGKEENIKVKAIVQLLKKPADNRELVQEIVDILKSSNIVFASTVSIEQSIILLLNGNTPVTIENRENLPGDQNKAINIIKDINSLIKKNSSISAKIESYKTLKKENTMKIHVSHTSELETIIDKTLSLFDTTPDVSKVEIDRKELTSFVTEFNKDIGKYISLCKDLLECRNAILKLSPDESGEFERATVSNTSSYEKLVKQVSSIKDPKIKKQAMAKLKTLKSREDKLDKIYYRDDKGKLRTKVKTTGKLIRNLYTSTALAEVETDIDNLTKDIKNLINEDDKSINESSAFEYIDSLFEKANNAAKTAISPKDEKEFLSKANAIQKMKYKKLSKDLNIASTSLEKSKATLEKRSSKILDRKVARLEAKVQKISAKLKEFVESVIGRESGDDAKGINESYEMTLLESIEFEVDLLLEEVSELEEEVDDIEDDTDEIEESSDDDDFDESDDVEEDDTESIDEDTSEDIDYGNMEISEGDDEELEEDDE